MAVGRVCKGWRVVLGFRTNGNMLEMFVRMWKQFWRKGSLEVAQMWGENETEGEEDEGEEEDEGWGDQVNTYSVASSPSDVPAANVEGGPDPGRDRPTPTAVGSMTATDHLRLRAGTGRKEIICFDIDCFCGVALALLSSRCLYVRGFMRCTVPW